MHTLRPLRRLGLACLLVVSACQANPASAPDTSVLTLAAQPAPDSSPGPFPGPSTAAQDAVVDPASASPAPVLPYPRGAWRLADPRALGQVVLWFSQIVIRHADARPEVSFSPAYWLSIIEATRTRAQALSLAQQVAAQAARDPASFPELARRYSEDLSSRDEGGALGGITADQISRWPQVLDALAALKPGETSQVVESPYGFHIFYRSAPPPEEHRSGAHIVIGHDRALWGWMFARGDRPPRTRDEALALANDIYRQAKAAPERFAELVQRDSEHRDAVTKGDIGSWSTREPSYFPPRARRLAELSIGEVGAPIETHLGFEIIQRTPDHARGRYRAAVLLTPVGSVDSNAPGRPDAAARAEAHAQAEATALRLLADPAAFDALGSAVQLWEWEEGRECPELTLALDQLQVGQLTPTPVDTRDGFILARRLPAAPAPEEAFETELPTPTPGALAELIGSLALDDARKFLQAFVAREAPALGLPSDSTRRLEALHELPTLGDGAEPGLRARASSDLFERTESLLGAERYARYQAALAQSVATRMPPDPQRSPLGL